MKSTSKSKDLHTFGSIYEKILKDLQSAGNAGEFTPRAVTQFMVDMVDPKLGEKVPTLPADRRLRRHDEHIIEST